MRKFNKYFAVGFIIGYFIISFIIFFWIDTSPLSLGFFIEKLIWSILGIFGAIVFGFFAGTQYKETKTTKQTKEIK